MANIEPATDADLQTIATQLERIPRGVLGVAARCGNDHPAVIATSPRLPSGEPFPTFYYLTCPNAVAACSRLEAEGIMREAESLLHDPQRPEIAAGYQRAHEAYIADRDAALEEGETVPEIAKISAGGMPNRVKCFHAILGHRLAAGPGVNPIGDWLWNRLQEEGLWSQESCRWEGSLPEETSTERILSREISPEKKPSKNDGA